MSAQSAVSHSESRTETTSRRSRLVSYLRDQVRNESNGELYFKGKFIADDVGLSPKMIGQLMKQLAEDELEDLHVEAWSYTSATTWRVTAQQ